MSYGAGTASRFQNDDYLGSTILADLLNYQTPQKNTKSDQKVTTMKRKVRKVISMVFLLGQQREVTTSYGAEVASRFENDPPPWIY